jgi:hypothetical protein
MERLSEAQAGRVAGGETASVLFIPTAGWDFEEGAAKVSKGAMWMR